MNGIALACQPCMNTAEALGWIAELFEQDPEQVKAETLREEIPAWDSLGVLTLMAALDKKFGVLLGNGEISAMKSVNDVLEVLRKNNKING
jgi:acyl carrier protein